MTRQFNELVHDLEQMTRAHPRHTGSFVNAVYRATLTLDACAWRVELIHTLTMDCEASSEGVQ